MTQNMFQEGLYQVFFKETPLTHPPTPATNHSELLNGRIHRWFGTVVNTRLLVTGIIALMGLNLFSLVFSFSTLLATGLSSTQHVALNTNQQRIASYVAKGSSMAFAIQCLLASVYILFLSLRGLRRYSPNIQAYSRISQDPDETNGPLLENVEFSL
ncbi:transmembrane protein 253 isoform X3 [Pseudochaenichthys georgianus]|uniref:transmembrane protein 253 isoform X3 n=1 Tax=Pseudochaenichthys georgianus TaxID=52239 RepID=UPI001469F8A7|nr:uncharacterized protein si:dkey-30c15.13 isoform X3 [Pseudochaenichthys georgianus]